MDHDPRHYLFVAGISDYDEYSKLDQVEHELEKVASALTGPRFCFDRILREITSIPPTIDILRHLEEWANAPERRPRDHLVIYWSGHAEVINERLHLILKNARAGSTENTILVEQLVECALGQGGPFGGVLLILDVCYAGQGAIDMASRLGSLVRSRPARGAPEIAILGACSAREEAKQNTFSDAFVQAIDSCYRSASPHDSQIWLHKIIAEVNTRISLSQKPILFNVLTAAEFFPNKRFVAEYVADRKFSLSDGIRRFEATYLYNASGVPVPFGGRTKQLVHLDGWLTNAKSDSCLLVSSPAGRGKSALLVKWMASVRARCLAAPEQWNLVFIPISIRFGTNNPNDYLYLLARNLAAISHSDLPYPIEGNEANYYKAKVGEFIDRIIERNIPTLIVVDGLDESLDHSLFLDFWTQRCSPVLRILVSARWLSGDRNGQGWLDRLSWPHVSYHHLELSTLDRTEIGDVLTSMGVPVSGAANDQRIVTRLAELTEGEPLLMRFYCEDLWKATPGSAPISIGALDKLKPGFNSYFKHWMDLQEKYWQESGDLLRRDELDAALAVLSFAKGPLEARDLLDILRWAAPEVVPPRLSWRLLVPLRRFVIGDGSPEAPYVLSHPKLGEYLRAEYFRECAHDLRWSFAEWGRQHVSAINLRHVKPAKASRYALQFVRHHFSEVGVSADTLMLLVEDGWRQAWEQFDGGPQGFAGDVQAVGNSLAANQSGQCLGARWRCAIALSTVNNLGAALPRALVVSAAGQGSITLKQGEHYAQLMKDKYEGALTLAYLACLPGNSEVLFEDLARSSIEKAINMPDNNDRITVLFKIAEILMPRSAILESQDLSKRLAATFWQGGNILRSDYRMYIVSKIGKYLSEDALKVVLRRAKSLTADGEFVEAIKNIAPCLNSKLIADAYAHACGMKRDYDRIDAISNLFAYLPARLHSSALNEILQTNVEWFSYDAFICVLPRLTTTKKLKLIESIVNFFTKEDEYYHRARIAIILSLPKRKRNVMMPDAEEAADAIRAPWGRARAFIDIAMCVPFREREGLLRKAMTAVKQVPESHRDAALAMIGPHLIGELCDEAYHEMRTLNRHGTRNRTLAALAPNLMQARLFDTIDRAHRLLDRERAEVIAIIAPHLSQASIVRTMNLLRTIENVSERAFALARLAPYLSSLQKDELFLDQIQAISRAPGAASARAIEQIFPYVAGNLVDELFSIVSRIADHGDRIRCCAGIASYLPPRLIRESFRLCSVIGGEDEQHGVIANISVHVPGFSPQDILDHTAQIQSAKKRYEALEAVSSNLPGKFKDDALVAAIATIRVMDYDSEKEKALLELLPQFDAEQFHRVLALIDEFEINYRRARALAAVAPRLPLDKRGCELSRSLDIAKTMSFFDKEKCEVLSALAKHLESKELRQCIAEYRGTLKKFRGEKDRCIYGAGLAPYMPETEKKKFVAGLLQLARSIREEEERSEALAVIADYLDPQERLCVLSEVLAAVEAIRGTRVGAISGPLPAEVDISAFTYERDKAAALSNIAVHLTPELALEALRIANTISDESKRADVLVKLMPLLSHQLAIQALHSAKALLDPEARSRVLAAVVPHLYGFPRRSALEGLLDCIPRLTRATMLARIKEVALTISGEKETIREIRRAVEDVFAWYP